MLYFSIREKDLKNHMAAELFRRLQSKITITETKKR